MNTAASARPAAPARGWLAGLAIAAAVFVAYAGAWRGPFVFDDLQSIPENPSIRALASREIFQPPAGVSVSGRPIVNASFALNHAFGGLDVRGYHATNIALHAAAALALFGLLRRLFARCGCSVTPQEPRQGEHATSLAFAATLLWALHPLHTEAVTYVVQRTESLMGLFYLLTLYAFARGAQSSAGLQPALKTTGDFPARAEALRYSRWLGISAVVCALGMATKEVMVTAPPAVLLIDRVFFSASWRELWRARRRYYFALAGTWLVLALCVWRAGDRAQTAGFAAGVSWIDYALVQARAIPHYLRLALWPHPLVFDYGPFAPSTEALRWLWATFTFGLLASTLVLWRKAPRAGVACFLVFLLLAPTSSVLPIETEPIAERRMYLPLAALTALGVVALARFITARGMMATACGLVAVAGASLTSARNRTYQSERTLWQHTVAVASQNPRAHFSFALALADTEDAAGAERELRAALALRPDYVAARNRLARLCETQGRLDEAIAHYETLLAQRRDEFAAHLSLGVLRFQRGEIPAAAAHFEAATRLDPASAPAHNNLGSARLALGDFEAARRHGERAIALAPAYPQAHYNLANALFRLGQLNAARASYERALALAPDYAEAHAHLGVVLQNLGERLQAIQHYRAALQRRPDYAFVRENLAALGASP